MRYSIGLCGILDYQCYNFFFYVPCLVQAWVVMVFQISLSLDALIISVSSTFIHSLRLFVYIILCLPLQRFPSILPLMLKLSISLFLITCPKKLICLPRTVIIGFLVVAILLKTSSFVMCFV